VTVGKCFLANFLGKADILSFINKPNMSVVMVSALLTGWLLLEKSVPLYSCQTLSYLLVIWSLYEVSQVRENNGVNVMEFSAEKKQATIKKRDKRKREQYVKKHK
jgi:hypothetical protein